MMMLFCTESVNRIKDKRPFTFLQILYSHTNLTGPALKLFVKAIKFVYC
jgi:hypothetical protein